MLRREPAPIAQGHSVTDPHQPVDSRGAAPLQVKGFDIHAGYLDTTAQRAVLEEVRAAVVRAPFVRPVTPRASACRCA